MVPNSTCKCKGPGHSWAGRIWKLPPLSQLRLCGERVIRSLLLQPAGTWALSISLALDEAQRDAGPVMKCGCARHRLRVGVAGAMGASTSGVQVSH